MKQLNLYNIKLSQIRIFLSVAECGGFSAAAEKLSLTQSFVSKTIAQLENEFGLYLFIRTTHSFRITPAGKKLYEQWGKIMQQFENSLISAHLIQTGIKQELRIGTGELCGEDNIIIRNVKKFQSNNPDTDVYLVFENMTILLDRLISGGIDLILISKHMLPEVKSAGLIWRPVIKSFLSIYVPRGNPLFERERLSFDDLKQEKFIVFTNDADISYRDLLKELGKEAGFMPEISCHIPNALSFKVNMELGRGIALADSFCCLECENIKRFDLDIRNDIIAVWKEDNYTGSIEHFCEMFEYENDR